MRVSYVGNFSVSFSTESHIALAWENLGVEVQRIPEQSLEWADLPDLVDGDLLLWTRTAGFDPPDKDRQRTALRQIKVPKVGYHLDRWWGLHRETQEGGPLDFNPSPFFTELDLLCTADGGHDEQWRSIGINHHWFPPAIQRDETEPGQAKPRFTADVAFVGNLTSYGHHEWAPYRRRLWDFLRRRYGTRFQMFPGRGAAIRGRDLADLYATVKVAVGDSCLVGNATRYWSDRIPETTGRGAFLIHPEVEGLKAVHPDLITYTLGNFDELGSLIDHALKADHWRKENAALNYEHTRTHHTYEHRMSDLLDILDSS